jgi:hypothetical protein
MTNVYADELYNPNFNIVSAPPTSSTAPTMISLPQNDVFSQRVEVVSSQYPTATYDTQSLAKQLVERQEKPQQQLLSNLQTRRQAARHQLASQMYWENVDLPRSVFSESYKKQLWKICLKVAAYKTRSSLQPGNNMEDQGPLDDNESKFLDSLNDGAGSQNFNYDFFNNAPNGFEPGLGWDEPSRTFMETTSSSEQQPTPVPQQPPLHALSHLQNQIAPSPLPDQQPLQAPVAMQGMTEDLPQIQQQIPPPQNIFGRQAITQTNLSPEDNAFVYKLASTLMLQASDEVMNQIRAILKTKLHPEYLRKSISQGRDHVFQWYLNRALDGLRAEKQKQIAQAEQIMLQHRQSHNTPFELNVASGIAKLRESLKSLPATLDDFIFSDNRSTPARLAMSPSPELRKESEKSYVASAIPIEMQKEASQLAIPQSIPVPERPMQQKGDEALDWPGSGRDNMQYQPDLATLQPSSYTGHAAAPEPQEFTSYPLYQVSGMLKLGFKIGEYFYCQSALHQFHLGHCNEPCIDGEQLQTHFEQQHSSFTRMEVPYRAICCVCEYLNSDASGACSMCGRYGLIQIWVCGNSIRSQTPLDDVVDAHKRSATITPGNIDQSEPQPSAAEQQQQQTHALPSF